MLLIVLAIIVVVYFLFFRNKDESKKESGFRRGLREKSTSMPSNAPACNSGCVLTENVDLQGNAADCGLCYGVGEVDGTKKYYTCNCPNKKMMPHRASA